MPRSQRLAVVPPQCQSGEIGRHTGFKIRKRFCIPEGNSYNLSSARVVKLVDTGDSKSPASNGVPVRVRPLVPHPHILKPKKFFGRFRWMICLECKSR